MKKVLAAFDNFFGGGKVYEPSLPSESSPVTITSFSQPHVLQTRMKEEKMSHGETVRATLSPVRLEMSPGSVVMYFCPMRNLHILEKVMPGDGNSIPAQAKVEGLQVPADYKPGFN
jgi:hypothetical protein